MDIRQKIEILKEHPLFKDLESNEMEILAERTREKNFPPKTVIIDQYEPANAVYYIYKGLVKIYILTEEGRIIPIRVRGPMYIVGELNLFDEESTASIETIQETHTLVFTKAECRRLLIEHPSFAVNLLKMITEKLRAANKQTKHYLSLHLRERTWHILKSLAAHFPNNEVSLSQEELSFVVGASRARVTEILDELAAEKLIVLSRRKIRVM